MAADGAASANRGTGDYQPALADIANDAHMDESDSDTRMSTARPTRVHRTSANSLQRAGSVRSNLRVSSTARHVRKESQRPRRPSSRENSSFGSNVENIKTTNEVLRFELNEARRMNETSAAQSQHIHNRKLEADARADRMHAEARHYASEAMQHHRNAVIRAEQSVQIGGAAEHRVASLQHSESQAQTRMNELSEHLAVVRHQQRVCAHESATAMTNYRELQQHLAQYSNSSEQNDA